MNNQQISRKTILLIAGGFFLLIGLVIMAALFQLQDEDPYRERLEISNLDEYTEGKPTDEERIRYIKHNLLTVVNLNSDETIESDSIDDIRIRDNSFSQEYDQETTLHHVEFIVDIESIKQSYNVSYEWVDNQDEWRAMDETGTLVTCLPINELRYGDFNCKDLLTEQSGETDPVLERLENTPISPIFKVYGQIEDNGSKKIIIQILANNYTQRAREQFDDYRKEARDWLNEQNVDLDTYTIEWRNLENEVVNDDQAPPVDIDV